MDIRHGQLCLLCHWHVCVNVQWDLCSTRKVPRWVSWVDSNVWVKGSGLWISLQFCTSWHPPPPKSYTCVCVLVCLCAWVGACLRVCVKWEYQKQTNKNANKECKNTSLRFACVSYQFWLRKFIDIHNLNIPLYGAVWLKNRKDGSPNKQSNLVHMIRCAKPFYSNNAANRLKHHTRISHCIWPRYE